MSLTNISTNKADNCGYEDEGEASIKRTENDETNDVSQAFIKPLDSNTSIELSSTSACSLNGSNSGNEHIQSTICTDNRTNIEVSEMHAANERETDNQCTIRDDKYGEVKQKVSDITRELNNMSFKTSSCTVRGCEIQDNTYMLKCSTCKQLTHYNCTQLPAYQLSLFLTKGYRIYVCNNCVGEISSEIVDNCFQQSKQQQAGQESRDVTYEKRIKDLEERIKYLCGNIDEKTQELDKCNTKCTKLAEHQEILRETIRGQKESIEKTSENDKRVNNTNNIHVSTQSEQPTTGNIQAVNAEVHQINVLEEIIDKRISKIEENLKEAIDSKISRFLKESSTYAAATLNESNEREYQHANKDTVINFRQVIKESRNEQLIEEEDKKNRSPNLIIHGIKENTDDPQHLKNEDDMFITSLLEIIGIESKPTAMVRLGKQNANKKRPLKLRMNSEKEKMEIMSRLKFLKNAEEKFKKLSITDDYTIAERAQIKEWKEKANIKNNEENQDSGYIWKVRGNPKNGIRLVRFTKQ